MFGAKSADRAENGAFIETQSSSITSGSGIFDKYNFTADEDYKEAPSEDISGTPLKENDRFMPAVESRKLIKDAYLSVETKDFDEFYSALEQSVRTLGGYTESADITVSSYDGHRFSDIVLRIPSEQLDSFLSTVSDSSTVTNKTVSVRDVTSTYIDIESRINALETEMATLLSLLEKSGTLSEVLEIQNRLTEVRSDLESMKSQMNVLQNQISFSKVTLSVTEVKREQTIKQEGFFSEVYSRLCDNFYSVFSSLREGAITLISSIPYLILIAIPVLIVVIVIKIIRRKRMK